jgi:hypothetical protein
MDIDRIVDELKRERARLDAAIAALDGAQPARRGRPPGVGVVRAAGNGRRRRHMSAAARRRISQAMKQRWAERKKKSA